MVERQGNGRRSTDGWEKHQALVLHKLDSLEMKHERMAKKIDALRTEWHNAPCASTRLLEQRVNNEAARVTQIETTLNDTIVQFKWFIGLSIGAATVIIAISKFLFGG